MLGTLAFYPTLAYNLFRNYMQPSRWSWFTRIDDNIILGAFPFKSMVPELQAENVGGVVCCTEDFEIKAAYTGMGAEEWEELGILFHHIPMQDFTGSTSRENLHNAVLFINKMAKEGRTTYVHCKAGRTRSATVVLCYLMFKNDCNPDQALEEIRRERSQVLLRTNHWNSVNDYRTFLDETRGKPKEEHKVMIITSNGDVKPI